MMQIKAIVLYSRWGDRRVVELRPGQLNIITGKSKTGKSAIGRVIEYALGSDGFTVFLGAIRDTVSWYGLLLQVGATDVFVARPDPGERQSTGDMYIEVGDRLTPPEAKDLRPNTNADSVRTRLARMIGIAPNLHEPPVGSTRRPLEARLSHALLYCFQGQNVVANPDVLFHKQNEEYVPQAIRDTFPYFLGAVDEDRLDKVVRLRQLRQEIRLLEAQFGEIASLREHSSARASTLLAEAREVGLVDAADAEKEIDILRMLAASPLPPDVEIVADDPTVDLRQRRNRLLSEFRDVQDALRVARRYREEHSGFASEARQQALRLRTVNLLPDREATQCPVCQQVLTNDHATASQLTAEVQRLEAQIEAAAQEVPRLQEYIAGQRAEAERITREVNSLDEQLQQLSEEQEFVRRQRSRELAKGRVIGRVSMFIESLDDGQSKSGPSHERLESLQVEAAGLTAELDEDAQRERLHSMTANLGRQIAEMADRFRLEHAGFSIRLDLRQLTLIIDQGKKSVPLSQVGSGENWVGYHLAFFLALHSWFRSLDRPVPAFIFIDQPTQVYFPPDSDSRGSLEELDNDEDRLAVRRMFEILHSVVQSLNGQMQIIVTDHADLADHWFQESVIEKWRGEGALIPSEWLTKAGLLAQGEEGIVS